MVCSSAIAESSIHKVTRVTIQPGTGGGLTFAHITPNQLCNGNIANTETEPLLEVRKAYLSLAMTALVSGKPIRISYSCNATSAMVNYLQLCSNADCSLN